MKKTRGKGKRPAMTAKERYAKWYAKKGREYHLKYRQEHREETREAHARFNENHPDYHKEYRSGNRDWADKHSARQAQRRADKLDRTPAWADLDAIELIYQNRPYCTVKGVPAIYHVDHIIPLKGKYVSGLHVAENLQYMYPTLNLQKSNKWAL